MGHNIRGILDKAKILSFNRLFHGKMVQTYLRFFLKKKLISFLCSFNQKDFIFSTIFSYPIKNLPSETKNNTLNYNLKNFSLPLLIHFLHIEVRLADLFSFR